VAGLNQILRRVLSNAGHAIAAMSQAYVATAGNGRQEKLAKRRVGITMFGVTTPAVDAIRKYLELNYEIEVYVFHATGHGGKAMERLVREGVLDAILDSRLLPKPAFRISSRSGPLTCQILVLCIRYQNDTRIENCMSIIQ
jgi:uncharacterized protein (UPF0261 family)